MGLAVEKAAQPDTVVDVLVNLDLPAAVQTPRSLFEGQQKPTVTVADGSEPITKNPGNEVGRLIGHPTAVGQLQKVYPTWNGTAVLLYKGGEPSEAGITVTASGALQVRIGAGDSISGFRNQVAHALFPWNDQVKVQDVKTNAAHHPLNRFLTSVIDVVAPTLADPTSEPHEGGIKMTLWLMAALATWNNHGSGPAIVSRIRQHLDGKGIAIPVATVGAAPDGDSTQYTADLLREIVLVLPTILRREWDKMAEAISIRIKAEVDALKKCELGEFSVRLERIELLVRRLAALRLISCEPGFDGKYIEPTFTTVLGTVKQYLHVKVEQAVIKEQDTRVAVALGLAERHAVFWNGLALGCVPHWLSQPSGAPDPSSGKLPIFVSGTAMQAAIQCQVTAFVDAARRIWTAMVELTRDSIHSPMSAQYIVQETADLAVLALNYCVSNGVEAKEHGPTAVKMVTRALLSLRLKRDPTSVALMTRVAEGVVGKKVELTRQRYERVAGRIVAWVAMQPDLGQGKPTGTSHFNGVGRACAGFLRGACGLLTEATRGAIERKDHEGARKNLARLRTLLPFRAFHKGIGDTGPRHPSDYGLPEDVIRPLQLALVEIEVGDHLERREVAAAVAAFATLASETKEVSDRMILLARDVAAGILADQITVFEEAISRTDGVAAGAAIALVEARVAEQKGRVHKLVGAAFADLVTVMKAETKDRNSTRLIKDAETAIRNGGDLVQARDFLAIAVPKGVGATTHLVLPSRWSRANHVMRLYAQRHLIPYRTELDRLTADPDLFAEAHRFVTTVADDATANVRGQALEPVVRLLADRMVEEYRDRMKTVIDGHFKVLNEPLGDASFSSMVHAFLTLNVIAVRAPQSETGLRWRDESKGYRARLKAIFHHLVQFFQNRALAGGTLAEARDAVAKFDRILGKLINRPELVETFTGESDTTRAKLIAAVEPAAFTEIDRLRISGKLGDAYQKYDDVCAWRRHRGIHGADSPGTFETTYGQRLAAAWVNAFEAESLVELTSAVATPQNLIPIALSRAAQFNTLAGEAPTRDGRPFILQELAGRQKVFTRTLQIRLTHTLKQAVNNLPQGATRVGALSPIIGQFADTRPFFDNVTLFAVARDEVYDLAFTAVAGDLGALVRVGIDRGVTGLDLIRESTTSCRDRVAEARGTPFLFLFRDRYHQLIDSLIARHAFLSGTLTPLRVLPG